MENLKNQKLMGAGLGLRRGMLDEMAALSTDYVDFLEVAPENWIGVSGRYGKAFQSFAERFPFVFHGLSLSIGSPDPLDEVFVRQIKQFMKQHDVLLYSEHLSYCSSEGHMYDLMPLPFTDDAVKYVSERIKRVQDILEQPIAMENVSSYVNLPGHMSELEFMNAVLNESGCNMLLDVNNVFVNSVNHGFDPLHYIANLPSERIAYAHIAGHYDEADDLLVDTHGADVKDDVWKLLEFAYAQHGVLPTLLERDFNFPPMNELLAEVNQIKRIQQISSNMTPTVNKLDGDNDGASGDKAYA